MGLVRKMKPYGQMAVANAMSKCGWNRWRTTNIEKMTQGIPRCDLERILKVLRRER